MSVSSTLYLLCIAERYPGSTRSKASGEYETINVRTLNQTSIKPISTPSIIPQTNPDNDEYYTYITDAELACPEYDTARTVLNSAPYNPDTPPQTPPRPRATATSEDYSYSYATGKTLPDIQQLGLQPTSELAYCDMTAGGSRQKHTDTSRELSASDRQDYNYIDFDAVGAVHVPQEEEET